MERLLVGLDGSRPAQAALRWAIDHAQGPDDELVVVYVVSSLGEWELSMVEIDPDPIRREFRKHLTGEWTEPVRAAGIRYRTRLLVGRPAEKLLEYGREIDATMLVVGMTGNGTLSALVTGSVTHYLLHHSVRPIVAVPEG